MLAKEVLNGSDLAMLSSCEHLCEYTRLEDADHKVYFFAFPHDAKSHEIPSNRRLYAELVLPPWTHWEFRAARERTVRNDCEACDATRATSRLRHLPAKCLQEKKQTLTHSTCWCPAES